MASSIQHNFEFSTLRPGFKKVWIHVDDRSKRCKTCAFTHKSADQFTLQVYLPWVKHTSADFLVMTPQSMGKPCSGVRPVSLGLKLGLAYFVM